MAIRGSNSDDWDDWKYYEVYPCDSDNCYLGIAIRLRPVPRKVRLDIHVPVCADPCRLTWGSVDVTPCKFGLNKSRTNEQSIREWADARLGWFVDELEAGRNSDLYSILARKANKLDDNGRVRAAVDYLFDHSESGPGASDETFDELPDAVSVEVDRTPPGPQLCASPHGPSMCSEDWAVISDMMRGGSGDNFF